MEMAFLLQLGCALIRYHACSEWHNRYILGVCDEGKIRKVGTVRLYYLFAGI